MLRNDYFHKGLWSKGGACSVHHRDTPQPNLRVVEGVHECPTCGLFQRVPSLEPGLTAACPRCGGKLERRRRTSAILAPLGFCVASLALYWALLLSPLLVLDVHGRRNAVNLISGPIELIHQGFGEIGILVGFTTVVMPGVVLALMLAILGGSFRAQVPLWIRPCMAWYERLRPWSMVEVYVIGLIVAYTKLVDMAVVTLEPGAFLLGGLMLMMAVMDSTFDASIIWRHQSVDKRHGLGLYPSDVHPLPHPEKMLSCHACHLVFVAEDAVAAEHDMGDCPRCGQILRRRKRNSFSATIAFLIASLSCYVPANLFPVMSLTKLGHSGPHTIIGGVIELWQSKLYFLSLLVLFASITVPVLKIVSLNVMLYYQRHPRRWILPWLSKLYRIVVFIGRWSMIDVFMISILVAVVRFPFFARVMAETGVIFFAAVVILTIFAADLYDPREMWDAAGLNDDHASSFSRDEKVEPLSGSDEMEPKRA